MSYTSPILQDIGGSDADCIDVDFQLEAEAIGTLCGMTPPEDELMGYSPSYEATQRIYPEGQWQELVAEIDEAGGWLERYVRKIKNQGREPSCTYNAAAQAMEIIWNKQFGTDKWRELSPISGYRWNGTIRSGSSVPGAVAWLESTGLLPVDNQQNRADVDAGYYDAVHPATGYSVQPQSGWKNTAKMFRADEWFKITSVAGFVSALIDGWGIVGGRDGHAVIHVRPLMVGGKIVSMYANSWGAWGATHEIAGGQAKGFGYDSRAKLSTMASRGAWALRSVLKPRWLQL